MNDVIIYTDGSEEEILMVPVAMVLCVLHRR